MARYELIVWRDAWSRMDWTPAKKIKTRPTLVTSVGILVKEDEHGIVLALDSSNDGDFNTYGLIPQDSVVSRTELVARTSAAPPAA